MINFNTATLNFGGINTSRIEFVDFSTPELKAFFQNLQTRFDDLPNDNTNLRIFLQRNFDQDHQELVGYLIYHASRFMVQNMDPNFIAEFGVPAEDFDLGAVPISLFVRLVMKKDKGIGGFEQLCQSRLTNIGRLNEFMTSTGNKNDDYTFDHTKFCEELKQFYLVADGLSFDKLESVTSYANVFLKGRKEGPDGSNRNYYMHYGPKDPRNGDVPEISKTTLFHSLANLVMLTYDVICMELLTDRPSAVASTEFVPTTLVNKPSNEEVAASKVDFIVRLLTQIEESNRPDVLFITECIPGIFDESEEVLSDFIIEYGPTTDGLCNAIIYNDSVIGMEFESVSVTTDVYSDTSEFKEVPLHLASLDGNFHLVSYHANGKGVTVNNTLQETGFYSWLDSLEGTIVLGGDLNMDFKKVGTELQNAFELGTPSARGFSCYKQRTPLQAQYDKAGVFDKKYCDYIITRGIDRQHTSVYRMNAEGTDVESVEGSNTISSDELVIPNNRFPFEHYIVMDRLTANMDDDAHDTDAESTDGISFFSSYISPRLSWIDTTLNWVFGFN
jgi:hypothetical protein